MIHSLVGFLPTKPIYLVPPFPKSNFRRFLIESPSIMLVLLLLLSWPITSVSQVAPGVQMFSTNEYGVDIANGSANIDIPFRSKVGKIPFSSKFVGTNAMTAQGGYLWPMFSYGRWSAVFSSVLYGASTNYSGGMIYCGENSTGTVKYYYQEIGNMSVVDSTGAGHSIPGLWFVTDAPTDMSSCWQHIQTTSGPFTASDASGYTLVVTNGANYTVYDKAGNSASGGGCTAGEPGGCNPPGLGITDPDGATIGFKPGTTEVIDSLGTEVYTGFNSLMLLPDSYLDINGKTQSYSATLQNVKIATAFGCVNYQGVKYPPDLPPTSTNLLMAINIADGGKWSFSYEKTPSGYYTGRIATITFPSGGSASYAYKGGNSGFNCNYWTVPELDVTIADGEGNSGTYKYVSSLPTAAQQNISWPDGTVTRTDPAGNQTVFTFWGEYQTQAVAYQGGCPTSTPGCNGGGTLLRKAITCYNENSMKYASLSACVSPSTPPVLLPVTQLDVYTYLGSSTSPSLVETVYDGYSNLSAVRNYDFGAPFPPSGTPLSETDSTYANVGGVTCGPVSTYIFNRSCTITTYNSGSMVQQVKYTYNAGGHPTQTSTLVGGSSSPLVSSASYNANGTIASFTDVNNAITNYHYNGTGGCSNLLLTSTVLPVSGLTTSQTWNCNGGVLTSSTDENSQPTDYGYVDQSSHADPLWRRLSVTDPLGNVTWTKYSPGGTLPVTVETFLNFQSSTVDILTTFDGLARPITSQKRTAPGAGTFDNTVTYGYGWTSTGPAPGPVSTQTFPGGTTPTTSQFDALIRNASITDANSGSLTTSYLQQDVNSTLGPPPTSENSKSRQLEYDGTGRLTSVCEILSQGGSSCGQKSSASGYLTSYAYGVPTQGQSQVSVTQGAQQRTYVSDGLGRLISETNPENSGVPPAIATKYGYDSDSACNLTALGVSGTSIGDLVSVFDANGNKTCYNYDSLHRITDIVALKNGACYPPVKRFRYDNSSNAILPLPSGYSATNTSGRMVEAWTGDCTWTQPESIYDSVTDELFAYSARGEMTDLWESTWHIPGYYHGTASYAANGALTSLGGVPGYTNVTYGLDGEGRFNSATQGSTSLVYGVNYTGGSQPQNIYFGAANTGDNDSYLYDPNTGRMTNWSFTIGSTPQSLSGTLSWNPNGTLNNLAITDGLNSGGAQTCYFNPSSGSGMGYDDLGRLVNVNCGSVWSQTFSYDQYDNLSKSGSLSWACAACYDPTTNRYNSTLSPLISYDANGNLLDDSFHDYGYYPDNKLASIDSTTCTVFGSTNGTCVLYDAFGRIVEKGVAGSYTVIMYTPAGRTAITNTSMATIGATFPLPGGATLRETGSTGTNRFIWHKDWLGSVRLESNLGARTSTFDRAFAPYGEMYNNFGQTDSLVFTGDLQDLSTAVPPSLFDTPNRELSANQGRWMSPDPAGLQAVDQTNPQSWNRYAYVLNNPLSNLDPSGLYCAYLNDAGNGVEEIDDDGDKQGCGDNGGYWIAGSYGGGSWVNINVDSGIVAGLGFDSSGNAEYSFAGASGSNAWGAWTRTFATAPASALGQSVAANNGNYAWTFTKGFFSNFSLKAVYRSFVDPNGCDRLMATTFAEDFNPLPSDSVGAGDAAELGPQAVAQAGRTAASAYSLYQGLSVPLRSSIYRGLQSSTYGSAAAVEEAAPYLQVGYAGADALVTAGSAAYNGECQ